MSHSRSACVCMRVHVSVCVHSAWGPDGVVDREIVLICPKTQAHDRPYTNINIIWKKNKLLRLWLICQSFLRRIDDLLSVLKIVNDAPKSKIASFFKLTALNLYIIYLLK